MVVQGAGFTYQGRLNDGSRPASGLYDMTFSLYGENAGGSRLRGPEPHSNVSVSNGLFAVTLDFGDKYFDGTVYWLEMAVRTNGESGFTILSQRRLLFPAPYAVFSTTAGEARAVAASNILGVLSAAQLPRLQGDGSGLTNLDASQIAIGTFADARLSSNVALVGRDQIFTGSNRFSGSVQLTNAANLLAGTFAGDGSGLTNVRASKLIGSAPSATNFTGFLAGDVTGSQAATRVSFVGGVSVYAVVQGTYVANIATSANTENVIVQRDASGGFAAGVITGSFAGSGSGLTQLSGDTVVTGTVADARLSSNVALLGRDLTFIGSNRFSGSVQLTNAANLLAGTFAGDASALTNLTAAAIVGTAPIVTNFAGPLLGDVTGSHGATVVSTVGSVSAASIASGVNAANAATSANTSNAIVQRDASGGFAAGVITGSFAGSGSSLTDLSGDAVATGTVADARLSNNVALVGRDQTFTGSNRFSGSVQLTNAANLLTGTFAGDGAALTNLTAAAIISTVSSATNFTGPLLGGVTGSQDATVVSTVGGVSAASVVSSLNAANAATSANTANAIVRRDASGDFSARRISGAFLGDGGHLTNVNASLLVGTAPGATNFTQPLLGDVTGGQGATVVGTVGGLAAANVASGANRGNAATPTNILGAIVRRDPCDASFSAGTITARLVGDGSGLTNLATSPPYYAPAPGAVLVSLFSPDTVLVAGGYRQFMNTTVPSWVNGSTSSAPSARFGHTTVWIGQAIIVWGGSASASTYLSSGAMYVPSADTWTALSTVNAPTARVGHTAVWTDTQMIVWGGKGASGNLGTGSRYDPSANTWLAITTTGAPSARTDHVAVWTGSRMLIWGGINASGLLNDGALYDPALNQWSTISLANAPVVRMNAVAVWAGDRMIVWGGTGESGELDSGGQLLFSNELPTQWLATTTASAPYARIGHTAVWTGDRMMIWGGQSGGTPLNDGAVYNAASDEWTGVSMTNAPSARYDHAAVWTGTEVLIAGGANSGGALSTSAAYDLSIQQWRPLSNVGGPLARSLLGAAWSGTEILVFGGYSGSQTLASLQRLSPLPAWYFYRKL